MASVIVDEYVCLMCNVLLIYSSLIYLVFAKEGIDMYNAIDIAIYILYFCTEIDKPITNMKLQSMMYFLQGNAMQREREEPIFDEDFRAMQIGPIIVSVYHEFRKYTAYDIVIDKLDEKIKSTISYEDKEFIDDIVTKHIDSTAWELADLASQGPCNVVFKMYGPNSKIPKAVIKKFFMMYR